MLHVSLVVTDGAGAVIDPGVLGIDALVEVIRAGPPDAPPGVPTRILGVSVDTLEAVERIVGQATALRAAAVCAVAEDTPGGPSTDQVLDEVAAALRVSRRSAQFLRSTAEGWRFHPGVWAALFSGQLDTTRARVVADALCLIPLADDDGVPRAAYAEEREQILAAALRYAGSHTARQLDRYLQRLLAELDPGCVRRRRSRALERRGVWLDHRGDGTSDLTARLATEDAERVYAAIRAVALVGTHDGSSRSGDHDPTTSGGRDPHGAQRPFDLRMADSFLDLLIPPGPASALDPGAPGGARGGRVAVSTQITVTIPVDSLAGLTGTPGVVSGFGVIPADVARRLAAGDARWRHVLTHAVSGAVLDVGTWSCRPPAAMDRHVRLRDGTCRFPGCQVPAAECDLDHLTAFPNGPTSSDNLHALCRRHHRLKHEGDWTVAALADNGLKWTSPLGTVAVTHPDDRLPDAA